jgi:hypothetical protein
MIRFLIRLCGLFVFAAAFVALVIDGSRSIAAGGLLFTPLNDVLTALWPGAVAAWGQSFQDNGVAVLRAALEWITARPTYLVLGLPGLLLMLAGRKRRPPLGLKPV